MDASQRFALSSGNPISLLQSILKSRNDFVREKDLKCKEVTTEIPKNADLEINDLAGDAEIRATTCLNVERRKRRTKIKFGKIAISRRRN